jgi:hypothetical protein
MILLEIAAVAALAPLLLLFFECWDRRTMAKREAFIARLTCQAQSTERTTAQKPTPNSSAATDLQ